jgi:hypothetical protein
LTTVPLFTVDNLTTLSASEVMQNAMRMTSAAPHHVNQIALARNQCPAALPQASAGWRFRHLCSLCWLFCALFTRLVGLVDFALPKA